MWLKMRTFYYDNLGIKKEFLYFWIVVLAFIGVSLVGIITMAIAKVGTSSNIRQLFWAVSILTLVNFLLFGLIPWPKWQMSRKVRKDQLKKKNMLEKRNSTAIMMMTGRSFSEHDRQTSASNVSIGRKIPKLKPVESDPPQQSKTETEAQERLRIECSWSRTIVTPFGYERYACLLNHT